jgi:TrmH family RNA methyltransferase
MSQALSKNKIKHLTSLRYKKYRQIEKKFLVEGTRMCEEAIQSKFVIDSLLVTRQFAESERGQRLVAHSQERDCEIIEVPVAEFNRFADTVHSQGVSALLRMPSPSFLPTTWPNSATLLALDAISDPGNMGTIIRTADWFALDSILLGYGCVEVYNPKVLRSTMGSIFHLPIYENIDLSQELSKLKQSGFKVCAGSAHLGIPLNEFQWSSKALVLIGSEAGGVDTQLHALIDYFVQIPRLGKAESLNVATATGILIFSIATLKNIRMAP